MFNTVLMAVTIAAGLFLVAGVVGLLACYAATFAIVAALCVALAFRGPLRDAGTRYSARQLV